jgi:hypothetical protein
MSLLNTPALIFTALLGTWFGAALFYTAIVGPALVEAGPSSVGFLQTLARRYGTGPFYALLAFSTVITGVWVCFAPGLYGAAGARNPWTILSVGLAVLALLLGALANRTAEGKWVRAIRNLARSATTEHDTEVAAALARVEKTNVITTTVLGLALICAVLSRTVS